MRKTNGMCNIYYFFILFKKEEVNVLKYVKI